VPGGRLVAYKSQSPAVPWALGHLVALPVRRRIGLGRLVKYQVAPLHPHTVGLSIQAETGTALSTRVWAPTTDGKACTVTLNPHFQSAISIPKTFRAWRAMKTL